MKKENEEWKKKEKREKEKERKQKRKDKEKRKRKKEKRKKNDEFNWTAWILVVPWYFSVKFNYIKQTIVCMWPLC